MWVRFVALVVVGIAGCGPSAHELREKSMSILNTEADRWDGSKEFVTEATDAYGGPIIARVDEGILNYTLELRSAGPDGLPRNSDDLVVTRSKRHGKSSIAKESAKVAEGLADGTVGGTIKAIKRGLGLGEVENNENKDK